MPRCKVTILRIIWEGLGYSYKLSLINVKLFLLPQNTSIKYLRMVLDQNLSYEI
jgi:hypothetical protein